VTRGFEPPGLPRHRNGITPGMVGRYPDFNVLDEVEHWDDVTRRVVLDRVENVPPIRFFDEREATTLTALCNHLTGQVGEEPKIQVLAYVDEKLWEGQLDGYQYFDMPDDREAWRRVARGLDDEARAQGVESFALLDDHAQNALCHGFSHGELYGGVWATLNVSRAFALVMRHICEAFYAHPWAWNEIGFGGPAYPRGYSRFGSPHLRDAETEAWEAKEAFELDPVRDTKRRGLD
jgi:Gluconate 2-dehydrogenase subunit 3